jgi:hypothetical protein
VCVIQIAMPQRTTWEIYQIQHCRGPGCPVKERYQFVDGHGRRRHFSTKARAKLERDKAKALFTQEGKLAAGMDEQQRRDAVQAVKLSPAHWSLLRAWTRPAAKTTAIASQETISAVIGYFF